jgi:site-specific DNA-methyltransferase (adenine-specific)
MPSPAKDRFTIDFEYLFFFVKNRRYYFRKCFEPWMDKRRHDKERAGKADNNKGGRKYNRKMAVMGNPLNGRNKRCVWLIPTTPFAEAHFATFPAKLCETPIKSGCPPNGIVLDPFMGSGTTGLVANKLGRKFIGIESNPKYIEMARKRMGQMSKI